MIVLVVASASLAAAVMPTAVPLAAFSSTALAVPLLSAGAVTSNSSTSPIVIVKVRVVVRRVAAGGADRDVVAAGRLAVDPAGHRDHARRGVDGKPSARVVVQRVADRIRAVRIVGKGRQADRGAVGRVLQHVVGRGVGVADAP